MRNLPVEADFVSLASLKTIGLTVEFDLGQMTLSINPAIEQRPSGHISLAAGEEPTVTDRFSKQSPVSGYMNVNAAAQYTGKSLSGKAAWTKTAGTASAIRILNVVFENEAT